MGIQASNDLIAGGEVNGGSQVDLEKLIFVNFDDFLLESLIVT